MSSPDVTRRDWLRTAGAALAAGPFAAARPPSDRRTRVLVFTRSAGHQHEVVKLDDKGRCLVHDTLTDLGARHNFDVECTKDGRVFLPQSLARYDAVFFFTTGDLTAAKSEDGAPPMPREGKKALLDAISSGKGFVGSHCASDTFHSAGERRSAQEPATLDPYIAMLGGEFIHHGDQQRATLRVADRAFPGVPASDSFELHEEWYSLKNFAPDLHVILVQETRGMKGGDYDRPPFPATWARSHGLGRVFYTSMGHRPDVWTNPMFQELLVGGLNWATGRASVTLTPNLAKETPQAKTMPPVPPPKKG